MLKWVLLIVGALLALVALMALIGALLPRGHRASRTVQLAAPPDRVYATIVDVARYPEWRGDVKSARLLPSSDGLTRFEEVSAQGTVRYRVEAAESPRRWVTRIDDPSLPYGGSWTFALRDAGTGTELTITEDGEVYNPVFRFLSRTVFSPTATIVRYQNALQSRLEDTPR